MTDCDEPVKADKTYLTCTKNISCRFQLSRHFENSKYFIVLDISWLMAKLLETVLVEIRILI